MRAGSLCVIWRLIPGFARLACSRDGGPLAAHEVNHPILDFLRLDELGMGRRMRSGEILGRIMPTAVFPPEKADLSQPSGQTLAIDLVAKDVQAHVTHQQDILPPDLTKLAMGNAAA